MYKRLRGTTGHLYIKMAAWPACRQSCCFRRGLIVDSDMYWADIPCLLHIFVLRLRATLWSKDKNHQAATINFSWTNTIVCTRPGNEVCQEMFVFFAWVTIKYKLPTVTLRNMAARGLPGAKPLSHSHSHTQSKLQLCTAALLQSPA